MVAEGDLGDRTVSPGPGAHAPARCQDQGGSPLTCSGSLLSGCGGSGRGSVRDAAAAGKAAEAPGANASGIQQIEPEVLVHGRDEVVEPRAEVGVEIRGCLAETNKPGVRVGGEPVVETVIESVAEERRSEE